MLTWDIDEFGNYVCKAGDISLAAIAFHLPQEWWVHLSLPTGLTRVFKPVFVYSVAAGKKVAERMIKEWLKEVGKYL